MCLGRQVEMFLNIQIDRIMLTKHREEERPQSVFAFEVLYLTDDTANRSTYPACWHLGGLQTLCQGLECCCEEDGKTEHKNKVSHREGTGQMHILWLKLE